ncbi:MAG: M15 family metallopeptidase [Clostridia bacterium]|nr:M15 family metallopeptidase [Clostridia bacterium]
MANRPQQRNSRSNTTVTLLVILLIAILANIFIFGTLFSDVTPRDTVNLRTSPITEHEEDQNEAPAQNPLQNYTPVEISSDELHFGTLALINGNNAYVAEGPHTVIPHETPADVYSAKTRDYYILDTSIDLNPTVIEKLNTMFADYKAHSGSANIMINAAYRTMEQQQAILEKKGEAIAAKPGFSEHHAGYALDICIFENGKSRTFADEAPYIWIPENCKKYGFIRRYPDGKSATTGITFEPWHYRYVGVPHSYYITENSLVLEEYIELVRHYTLLGEHLKITADGKNYEVYFVPAEEKMTSVYCPKDKNYTISGNNVDGFIVTVDLTEIIQKEPEQPSQEVSDLNIAA